ncbi:hypothetical protein QUF50_04570 [Thiotrichales bacterium HSG1]|nr:hypothetical protein [Thiotrichales bacterium HSG1]
MKNKFLIKEQAIHARMIYNSSIWRQLPYILVYPLQGYALFLIIIFSLMLFISVQSPFGIPAFAIIAPWTLQYAYKILEDTILGHAIPPMFIWNPINIRPLKQLIYILAIFSIYQFIDINVGYKSATFILIFGLFLTPASAVIIANQNNFLATLNPIKLVGLTIKIGPIYILFILLFAGLGILIFQIIITVLLSFPGMGHVMSDNVWYAENISQLFVIPLTLYLLCMTFHLLGFIVYHKRETLDFEAFFSPEKEQEAQRKAHEKYFNNTLDKVYCLTKQKGKTKEAITILFARIPKLGDTLDIHKHLFERLCLWDEKAVAIAHGNYYLSLLIQKQYLIDALNLYQICLDMDGDFKPKNSYHILTLATVAYDRKYYQMADDLVKYFIGNYSKHPDIIAVKELDVKLNVKIG